MVTTKRVKLSEVATLITKGTTPTTLGFEFQETGINFLKIECFEENGEFIPEKVAHISEKCNDKLKRSQLAEGDILFSIAGAIGRVAIVTKEILPANTNQALSIIRIDRDDVHLPFVKLILTSPIIKKQFERKKQGVAQLNLSLKDIGDLEIPLPSQREQIEFTDKFSKIQCLINHRKQQLAKLDELVKARFVEMFGEPIDNPMGWQIKPLKELSTLITNGNTPKGGSENYVDSGIIFLRSQNVWRNRIDLSDVAYIDEDTNQKMRKSIVKHKDILITKTGRVNTENSSLGRAALYLGEDDSANINGHVYLVRLNDSVVPEFVVTILTGEAYRKYIRKVCVGGIDKRQINLDQVEDFPIILPPIEQQRVFAGFSNQINKSKVAVQKALDEAQLLFDSLMQEYFG
ncbi:MAG: restriction endonuclease subunit S [Ruminococcus sp.]|nr:restriction endonuclease subunit S [Ruminococcus sp.]